MKQKSAVVVVATLVAALLLAPMASADEKSKKSKKVAQASTLTSICKPTSAVGHSPKRLAIPSIKRPHVNRIITLKTNCGEIQIAADGVNAPLTVISMTYLANKGYFDNSPCHRLTTQGIFVLQCGDPTASGSGGPAWQVPDENLPKTTGNIYPAGSVAMANSGANTNGSQFFIVYDDNSRLGANYTLWGRVTKGLDIVKTIAALGSNNQNGVGDGAPNQAITIERAVSR
jgi:peptidyl-prolyl cis-trans isomerase B (cyclophilin B)